MRQQWRAAVDIDAGTHQEYRTRDSMLPEAAKLPLTTPESKQLMPSWNEADNPPWMPTERLRYRVDINRARPRCPAKTVVECSAARHRLCSPHCLLSPQPRLEG